MIHEYRGNLHCHVPFCQCHICRDMSDIRSEFVRGWKLLHHPDVNLRGRVRCLEDCIYKLKGRL